MSPPQDQTSESFPPSAKSRRSGHIIVLTIVVLVTVIVALLYAIDVF
jgi:hypothetical protein